MDEALGGVLPLAVGVALSPVPVIAVILMLVGRHASRNGPMFVTGWLVGLALVGAVVLGITGPADASDDGEPAGWVAIAKLGVGVLLVLVAVRQWRGRQGDGEEATMPTWMRSIDAFTPARAFVAGVVLAGLNPKNLLLAVAAATTIAATEISADQQAIAYGVFTVVATVGVAAPVVIYFALGDRAPDVLERLKTWMARHNAAIMATLCLIIGVSLIGDGIALV